MRQVSKAISMATVLLFVPSACLAGGAAAAYEQYPTITAVQFSPDGKWAVTADKNGAIRLWDLDKCEERYLGSHTKGGRSRFALSAAFSRDGKQVLSGGEDRMVRLWDVGARKERRRFAGHEERVTDVALSPDGRWGASGSSDRTVRVWDLDTGKEVRKLLGHKDQVLRVAFGRNGRTLWSGSRDNRIRVWDVATGETIQTWEARGWVEGLAVAPGGDLVVATDGTASLSLWQLGKRAPVRTFPFKGETGPALAFSSTGRYIATGEDGRFTLREVASGKVVLRGEDTGSRIDCVAISPDGRRGLSAGQGALTVWDATTGEEVRTLTGAPSTEPPIYCVAFSPDGKRIFCGGADCKVKMWDVTTRTMVGVFEDPAEAFQVPDFATGATKEGTRSHERGVWGLAVSPKGGRLLTTDGSTAKLWDTSSRRLVRTVVTGKGVYGVAFSGDGALLACVNEGGLGLYDARSGKRVRQLEKKTVGVDRFLFSPDGKLLIVGYQDATLKVWAVNTWTVIKRREAGGARRRQAVPGDELAHLIGFAAARRSVVLGNGRRVVLWDVMTGEDRQEAKIDGRAGMACALSPDGRYMLTGSGLATTGHGSRENILRLWNISTGKLLRVFVAKGVPERVKCIAFEDSGKLAVSGGEGQTLKLWEVATGREVCTFGKKNRRSK